VTLTELGTERRLSIEPFPAGFLWGAATAAYQIEGAVAEGGRGPSIWDTFSRLPGKTVHGDTGDIACDHYHRWPDDIEIMRQLGLGSYRMSVSWSRLQPAGSGALNPVAVSHYRQLLTRLNEVGVRPLVTLYHWDLPQPLEDAGGWPSRDTAKRFADYAAAVVRSLGDLANDWITVNEPWCSAFLGYGSGAHAPGRTDLRDAVAAAHHLNLAHGLGVRAARAERSEIAIGGSNLVTDIVAASTRDDDVVAALNVDANNNRMFLDPMLRGGYPDVLHTLYDHVGLADLILDGDEAMIGAQTDFVGLNHYQQIVVHADPTDPHLGARVTPAEPTSTSLGWSVKPESLYNVLTRISREYTKLPLYITESGACFEDYVDPSGEVVDTERIAYLHDYLTAAGQAIREGVNLQGYFAWSLLDNFEWAEGYRKRFGLVYVDYATQTRIPKASAAWYRESIARHTRAVGQDRSGDAAVN
jgi:beta-glucosidase